VDHLERLLNASAGDTPDRAGGLTE